MKTGSLRRHGTTILLGCALAVTLWGIVSTETARFLGTGLSLVILALVFERLSPRGERGPENSEDIEQALEKVADNTATLLVEQGDIKELVQSNKDTSERYVGPFFGATLAEGNRRYFQQLKLSWSFRATAVEDRGATIEVDRNDSIRLWRDSLIDSTTWDALSFAHDLWRDGGDRRISEAYQTLHQQLGGRNRIRRVFLMESHHDLDSMMPVLTQQVTILGNDNVRWMLRPDLMALVNDRGDNLRNSPLLHDLDFAVVNESFVLWFILDGRQLSKSKLTEVNQVVESAKQVFRLSYDNGHTLR